MEPIIIDLETSIKNRGPDAIGKDKASPFVKENKIVWLGVGDDEVTRTIKGPNIKDLILRDNMDIFLVGHNIKFDLLYILRDNSLSKASWWPNGIIWDTQLAEYIITGQKSKYATLDELSLKYGGEVKDSRLKELWNDDVDTEDIPQEMIEPYLEGDIDNTRIVFKEQVRIAEKMGLMPLIATQMKALKATIEMEHNGLHFDKKGALTKLSGLEKLRDELREYVTAVFSEHIPEDKIEINPESKDHLSVVLFGGKLKYKADVPVLDDDGNKTYFKSGARKGHLKTRKEDKWLTIKGFGQDILPGWETKKVGIYKTDEEVLKYLEAHSVSKSVIALVKGLLILRELSKDVTTYFRPYIALCHADDCIHGKLNHVSTATGRLSSTSPNLQNITNSED